MVAGWLVFGFCLCRPPLLQILSAGVLRKEPVLFVGLDSSDGAHRTESSRRGLFQCILPQVLAVFKFLREILRGLSDSHKQGNCG